jgi:hypothetical protein
VIRRRDQAWFIIAPSALPRRNRLRSALPWFNPSADEIVPPVVDLRSVADPGREPGEAHGVGG